MNGYCRAYPINALQHFPAWCIESGTQAMIQEEDSICYLWDDFVVRSSPIRREKMLFTTVSPAWIAFCKEHLQFEVPGGISCSPQHIEQRDETSSLHRKCIPFTCGQQWLIEELNALDQYYCNIVFAQPLMPVLSGSALESIIKYMMEYHDAFRLRIISLEDKWYQFITDVCESVPFTWVCVSEFGVDDQRKILDDVAIEMQLQINTLQGYLWHATFCETGDVKGGHIIWSTNHFIYDGFSLEIVLQDFHTLYQQLCQGKVLRLPPKTTSFEDWTYRVSAYLHSPEAAQEIREYWLKLPWQRVKPFPLDFPAGRSIDSRSGRFGYGTRSSSGTVVVSLGVERTQTLLTKVVHRHTQIMDVFLTAMALTLTSWNNSSVLSIFVQDNARLTMFDDIDLLRTVGYIAQANRLLLDLQAIETPQDALTTIKKQLRQAPNSGHSLEWFLRRGDNGEIADELKQLPFADLHFNFRGRVNNDDPRGDGVMFLFPLDYKLSLRNHVLSCDATITDGDAQFVWEYSTNIHLHSTIERVATHFIEVLKDLIALSLRN